MILQYRADGFIVLVDREGIVRSVWFGDGKLKEFCNCTVPPWDWDDHGSHQSADYFGALLATRRGYTLQVKDREAWRHVIVQWFKRIPWRSSKVDVF